MESRTRARARTRISRERERGRGRGFVARTRIRSDGAGEATERLERIPSFVRGMLTKRVESYAREKGHTEISLEVMDEVRSEVLGGRVGNVPPFVKKMLSKK